MRREPMKDAGPIVALLAYRAQGEPRKGTIRVPMVLALAWMPRRVRQAQGRAVGLALACVLALAGALALGMTTETTGRYVQTSTLAVLG